MDTGLKRTKIIEGEPFPLKGSVHQLGGTHGDTATEEEDHRECLRGRTRTDPRESENVYFNVMFARKIIVLWADYMQLEPRKGNIKNSFKHLYIRYTLSI